MKVPHAALIVVADGEKYLILENRGDPDLIDLRVCAVEEAALARTGKVGTDRPGRYPGRDGRRSAVEQTDWKSLDKASFVVTLASELNQQHLNDPKRHIVIMADARTLGTLRRHLDPKTAASIMAEIEGDFAHHTTASIEAAVNAA